MARLQGKTALVTGAGGQATASSDDVATPDGAAAAVNSVIDAHGQLDVLVNNAGILRDAMSFSMTDDDWSEVLRVHLTGHFAPARMAAAHWRARAKAGEADVRGRIVNTTSESGLYGLAGQANYAAAKAGIAALTVSLARELGKHGVAVNAIIAPRARTRMTETVLGSLLPGEGGFDEWDPANVRPGGRLAGVRRRRRCHRQVLVVAGDKVHLMTGWSRIGRIANDGRRWTVDDLEDRLAELFGERGSGLPVTRFGE